MNGLNLQEKEVIKELAAGKTTEQIAEELELTYYYTRRLVQSAMDKLSASTKVEAVARAVREGII